MAAIKVRFYRFICCVFILAAPQSFAAYDVLDLPAISSDLASTSLLYTVVKSGDRYFSTGHRGHIIYSDDNGASWSQAQVPVRSAILDIHFVNAEKGWAVGHEGVVLHTNDGGESWVKQFDGNQYGDIGLAYYQKLLATEPENETYQLMVEEMEFAVEQGADKPFFKVQFHNERQGHALGAYGMLIATEDGGTTWEHRLHEVDNPGFNHLFDVADLGNGKFLISGEMGVALAGDINARTGKLLKTPWEGSFFTCVTAADGSVVMAGLRGKAYRSEDQGETWLDVDKPMSSSIVDSTVLSDGRLLLAGQAGEVLISADNGKTFSRHVLPGVERTSAITEGVDGNLIVAGPNGIQIVPLVAK